MDLLKKILNLYIAAVGTLACLWLLLAIIYVESASHGVTGRFADIRHGMIAVMCMIVLVGMVCTAGLMLLDEPEQLFVRTVAVLMYALGGSVALALAIRATPSNLAGASALDWLVVAALYLLGAAASASALLSLFSNPEMINDRTSRPARSVLKVG